MSKIVLSDNVSTYKKGQSLGKITVVTVANPFKLHEKTVAKYEYEPGRDVLSYAKLGIPDYDDIVISINGRIVEDLTICPANGDYIAVMPVVGKGGKGGKGIFGLIASIALSVVAMGVGSLVAGGAFMGSGVAAIGTWGLGSFLAAGAVMYLGGMLINGKTPKIDLGNADIPTVYSWQNLKAMQGQGNPVPLTFGTVKFAGQLLAQHITTDGDNQFLNLLLGAGEGALTEIKDVKINNNPVENYSEIEVDIRLGTNTQEVIPNFSDTFADIQLSYKLSDDWSTHVTEGNSGEGLELAFECPNGLYYAQDNGSLATAWVTIDVEYRVQGDENWTPFLTNERISGATSSAVRRIFRIDNIPMGRHEVRVKVIGRSTAESSTRANTTIYWTQLSHIIYDDFLRPNKALVAVKALATNQLSGSMPEITWLQTRSHVLVYDEDLGEYDYKPATNPAWACYDIIHGARELEDPNNLGTSEIFVKGASLKLMIYRQFANWAEMCDRKDLQCNYITDQTTDFWRTLIPLETAGRGKVMQVGTRYGCVYDDVGLPVQLFTMGNIYMDTFKEDFLGVSDRANSIEVAFNNAANDYNRETVVVFSDTYDTDENVNPTQLAFDAITSYEQVYREAMYQLYCNQRLIRTCSFDVDVDAISCQVGDVVLVSHDVPLWGWSGRIVNVIDNQTIELDRSDGAFETGKIYNLIIRTLDDKIITKEVRSLDDGLLKVKTPYTAEELPSVDSVYVFGEVSREAKPFRVISLNRSQDMRRRIQLLEYDEAVFNENYDIPPVDYSYLEFNIYNVINLSVSQVTWNTAQGNTLSRLYFSYRLPQGGIADTFLIYIRTEYDDWSLIKTTSLFNDFVDVAPYKTYYLKVVTQRGLLQSTGTISEAVETGLDAPPPPVKTILTEELGSGTRRFWWSYDYPDPNDVAGFELRYIQGAVISWDRAQPLHTGVITAQPFETNAIRSGTHTILIKAVDHAGSVSVDAVWVTVNFGDELRENVLWEHDFKANAWEGTLDGGFIDNDGCIRGKSSVAAWVSVGDFIWISPAYEHWQATFQAFEYRTMFVLPATGQWWLEHEISGAAQVFYRRIGHLPFWEGQNAFSWQQSTMPAWKLSDDGIQDMWVPYAGKIQLPIGSRVELKIDAPGALNEQTVIKKLIAIVDVPDLIENMSDVFVSASGLTIYQTQKPFIKVVAVRVNAVQSGGGYSAVNAVIVNRNPIKIMLYDNNNQPASATVDITLQGY